MTTTEPKVDPIAEASQRVIAARNNLLAVLAGAWPFGTTSDDALRGAVSLLDQANEWLLTTVGAEERNARHGT